MGRDFDLTPTRDDMIEDIAAVFTPDAHSDHAFNTPGMRALLARASMVHLRELWTILHGCTVRWRIVPFDDHSRHTENGR